MMELTLKELIRIDPKDCRVHSRESLQRQSHDKGEIDRYAAKAKRLGDVSSVLFMERS